MKFADPASRRGLAGWILFVAIFFGLPAAGCSALDACHVRELRDVGPIDVSQLADTRAAPTGARVEATGQFVRMYTDELPIGGIYAADVKGASLWIPEGQALRSAPVLVFAASGATPPSDGRVRGQICDEAFVSPCRIPKEVQAFIDAQRKAGVRDAAPVRVLNTYDGRGSAIFGVAVTSLFAAVLVGLLVAMVVIPLRPKRGYVPFVEEHVWTVPLPLDRVAAAIASLGQMDALRIAHQEPRRIVFFQGRTEYQIRLLGMRSPDVVLRCADVTWEQAPYQPTRITVRVEDRVSWVKKRSPEIAALLRDGLARTVAQLATVLRG